MFGNWPFLTCSEIYKLQQKSEIRSALRQNTNPEMIHNSSRIMGQAASCMLLLPTQGKQPGPRVYTGEVESTVTVSSRSLHTFW